MTAEEALALLSRIDAIWPRREARSDAELDEWTAYLAGLDAAIAARAVDAMRAALVFPPSMADLRSAYDEAALLPVTRPALPAGRDEAGCDFAAEYGHDRRSWVYCWRCDMAISLEERATTARFRPGYGLEHVQCPRSGSAPVIPVHLRLEREQARRRRGLG